VAGDFYGCAGARLGCCNNSARNETAPVNMTGALAHSKNSQSRPKSPIPSQCVISRDLLRLFNRIFGSGLFRSGLLPWHYSRIWNHFWDVDRL
jgi:hypothetical protein